MVEANRLLHEFQNNPFYGFFASQLQELANEAMVCVVAGFKERDIISLVEREQVIGAAPVYLKFAQLAEGLKEDLQIALQEQQ